MGASQLCASFVFFALVLLTVPLRLISSGSINIYVSVAGNDSNAGTLAQPYLTIAKGLSSIKEAGTTLWIGPGTYYTTSMLSIYTSPNGNSTDPITISGMPNQPRPIIDASGITSKVQSSTHVLYMGGLSYYVVTGISFRNSPLGHCLAVQNSLNLEISNNEMTGCFVNGIWALNTNMWAHDNWVHNNLLQNQYLNASNWGEAIGVDGCKTCTFERNLVEGNYGEGIDIFGYSSYNVITANSVIDSFSVSIYNERASNNIFQRNFMRTLNPNYFRGGAAAHGPTVADEELANNASISSINNTFINNIAVGASVGWYYGAYTGDGTQALGLRKASVRHNSFINCTSTGISIDQPPLNGSIGNTFAGNVFNVLAGQAVFTYIDGRNNYSPQQGIIEFHYNAYWNKSALTFGPGYGIIGDNTVLTNPLLDNIQGSDPMNFFPATGSPLIGAGSPTYAPPDDFFGQPRSTTTPDLGAIGTHSSTPFTRRLTTHTQQQRQQ